MKEEVNITYHDLFKITNQMNSKHWREQTTYKYNQIQKKQRYSTSADNKQIIHLYRWYIQMKLYRAQSIFDAIYLLAFSKEYQQTTTSSSFYHNFITKPYFLQATPYTKSTYFHNIKNISVLNTIRFGTNMYKENI